MGLKVQFLLFGAVFMQCILSAGSISGFVESTTENRYRLTVLSSDIVDFNVGDAYEFNVGLGDQGSMYESRKIQAEAVYYSERWNLEKIFPIDGVGAKAYRDANTKFHKRVATMSRRNFIKEGEYVLPFSGINQDGDFFQIKDFLGKAVVINFIFTRCRALEMCPASTKRRSILQERARELGLEDIHFLTISFDPENDSPGILKQYAESYELELDNFTLMTSKSEWIDDLMRYFGIIRMQEDGTINHTMATLLLDPQGRVHFRKEGSKWGIEEFLSKAEDLLGNR